MSKLLTQYRHPLYDAGYEDWEKWRLTYNGGRGFVNRYLEKYSDRETDKDFIRRRMLTPTPNFAKSAINEIKNSIFQRLVDVSRKEGPSSYLRAVTGEEGGVDLHGASMSFFMGQEILTELLVMSKVGIYIDMPDPGSTLRDSSRVHPYLYSYKTEDILSWTYHPRRRNEFSRLLLRDYVEIQGETNGLVNDSGEQYRFVYLNEENRVVVELYTTQADAKTAAKDDPTRASGTTRTDTLIKRVVLDLDRIPFTLVSLQDSLLADVANHQIALLNLESSDVDYALRANFPFYTEQANERDYSHFNQAEGSADNAEPTREITVGAARGRKYGKGMDRPGYIAPPTDPLQISMEKQQQLKRDIRDLVHLAVKQVSVRESAESKDADNRGLEAGLSQIGLILEHAERKIGEFWAAYENTDPPRIIYPAKYNVRSDKERREDAKDMADLRSRIPSKTFQRELTYQIADTLVGYHTPKETMDTILSEIQSADAYSGEPRTIFEAVAAGILDLETASQLLGYPEDTVEKAAEEHADRLARIQASQAKAVKSPETQPGGKNPAARGVGDLDPTPLDAASEKDGKRGRGPSKTSPE